MLILRQKTLDAMLRAAVADAVADIPTPVQVPDLTDEVMRLRIEVDRLHAEQARQPEIMVLHVQQQVDREKRERMADIAALEGTVAIPVEPTPVDLTPFYDWTNALALQVREAYDLATYLYDAPTSITTVTQVQPQSYGVLAVSEQHQMIRPMGAR